jgi:PAS domain S-box-containing protein
MADHTEQLVGNLFHILSEEGYTEAQQALLSTYQSRAATDRAELTEDLFSELVAVLHEHVDTRTQVTVLTRAAERLLNRFLTVVETAPVAIVIVDSDGAVQVWNDGAERLFGWSDAEMRGRVYPDALTAAVETDEQFHTRLRDGEQLHGVETQHTHADGGRRDVRVWAAPIQTQADDFDGGVFVVSDITEQKRREQRLSVLNRVLRHNIRTDVTVIRGHLDMLREDNGASTGDDVGVSGDASVGDGVGVSGDVSAGDDAGVSSDASAGDGATATSHTNEDHIRIIDERLSNITELSETARSIEQLRGGGEADRTTVDLASVLRERATRLREESPGARVTVDVPDLPPVVAHELLPYAFDNVLDNAVEHNDSDTPRVDIEATVTTESESAGRHVVVRVADNGPGLPPMERRVLASEVETQLDHSSGLGLWLTRWIVQSSDGSISVLDSDFGGTCVAVRLRAVSE